MLPAFLDYHLHEGISSVQEAQTLDQLWHVGGMHRFHSYPHDGRGLREGNCSNILCCKAPHNSSPHLTSKESFSSALDTAEG